MGKERRRKWKFIFIIYFYNFFFLKNRKKNLRMFGSFHPLLLEMLHFKRFICFVLFCFVLIFDF